MSVVTDAYAEALTAVARQIWTEVAQRDAASLDDGVTDPAIRESDVADLVAALKDAVGTWAGNKGFDLSR